MTPDGLDTQLRLLAEHVRGRRTSPYAGAVDYLTAAELLAVLDDGEARCLECHTALHPCQDCRGVHCNDYGCPLLPVDCETEMRRWDEGDRVRAERKERSA